MSNRFAGPTYAPFHEYCAELEPLYPSFLNAHTDKHLNLDIRNTSFNEAEHAHMKVMIGAEAGSGAAAARKNMLEVTKGLAEHFKRQYGAIQAAYMKERSRRTINLGPLGQVRDSSLRLRDKLND